MSETIEKLVKTIRSRKGSDIKSSYTAHLLSKGNEHCLNKLKEEVAEFEDAIKNKKNTVHETADVIYHLLLKTPLYDIKHLLLHELCSYFFRLHQ